MKTLYQFYPYAKTFKHNTVQNKKAVFFIMVLPFQYVWYHCTHYLDFRLSRLNFDS